MAEEKADVWPRNMGARDFLKLSEKMPPGYVWSPAHDVAARPNETPKCFVVTCPRGHPRVWDFYHIVGGKAPYCRRKRAPRTVKCKTCEYSSLTRCAFIDALTDLTDLPWVVTAYAGLFDCPGLELVAGMLYKAPVPKKRKNRIRGRLYAETIPVPNFCIDTLWPSQFANNEDYRNEVFRECHRQLLAQGTLLPIIRQIIETAAMPPPCLDPASLND